MLDFYGVDNSGPASCDFWPMVAKSIVGWSIILYIFLKFILNTSKMNNPAVNWKKKKYTIILKICETEYNMYLLIIIWLLLNYLLPGFTTAQCNIC